MTFLFLFDLRQNNTYITFKKEQQAMLGVPPQQADSATGKGTAATTAFQQHHRSMERLEGFLEEVLKKELVQVMEARDKIYDQVADCTHLRNLLEDEARRVVHSCLQRRRENPSFGGAKEPKK